MRCHAVVIASAHGQLAWIFRRRRQAAVPEAGSGVKYSVPQRLRLGAGQVGEQWSIEAHHHIRDVTFGEAASASRTGSGPVNLPPSAPPSSRPSKTPATRTSPKAAATTPPQPEPSASMASIRTDADIHGTRRSPGPARGRPRQVHPGCPFPQS